MDFNRNELTRWVWRIMPMALRHHLINRMCGKYNCRLFKMKYSPYAVFSILGDGWIIPCCFIDPHDCWSDLERTVLEYSVIAMFQ